MRETLTYAAHLRLPISARPYIAQIVLQTIQELGLAECADTLVGGTGDRKGISGGEKRRLSIGCVLVSFPSVLILDEVTTGLGTLSPKTTPPQGSNTCMRRLIHCFPTTADTFDPRFTWTYDRSFPSPASIRCFRALFSHSSSIWRVSSILWPYTSVPAVLQEPWSRTSRTDQSIGFSNRYLERRYQR